jgi:TM2 domain-containing membrane protein YozV
MAKTKQFLPRYSDDYQIFEARLEVAGVVHRKEAALRFARGDGQALKLQSEPSNRYDRNAIRVIGVWSDSSGREKNTHVGYLEKDLAKLLTQNDYLSRVLPRLESIFLGGHSDGWVGIYFQILGPKRELAEYRALWRAQGKVAEGRSTEAKTREAETVLYNDDEEDWIEVSSPKEKEKSRLLAILFAMLLGGIGVHKFYLGKPIVGFLYFLFALTGIPLVLGICEGTYYLLMGEEKFQHRYSR